MNTKLSYEEWRDNLPNLQNIINRTRNKNLRLKIFELREVKSSKQPKKREAFMGFLGTGNIWRASAKLG